MSERPSPWRANDAVLYDALRDEFRSSIAVLLTRVDAQGTKALNSIQRLRSTVYTVDGFDRAEVTASLNNLPSHADPSFRSAHG